jgi:hypothetical protein
MILSGVLFPANSFPFDPVMKRILVVCLIGVFGSAMVQAEGPRCEKGACPVAPAPCSPPPITWVEKTITMYRPELKSHDVKDTVEQLHLHPEPCMEKYLLPELVPIPQTKRECIPRLVPHQVVNEVCYTRTVAETVIDPCTGCAKTILKTVPAVKKVVQTIFDVEMVEQEVPITTYGIKVEEKERAVAHLIGEIKPLDIVRRSYSLELVPYQVKVKVPVCATTPPTCAKDTLPPPRELPPPAPEREK